MSFTVTVTVGDSCNTSVISSCFPFCVRQTKQREQKHKHKSLQFPLPAFATQKQCFISMLEVMETQKETSHVYQTGPSEAEACSGSSVQIQRRAPVAAADLVDFSASVQTPSFQPVSSPVSRIVSI